MLVGLSLVVAGACVFNNVLDRSLDARMERTRRRALVVGQISPHRAFVYGWVLSLAGLGVLLGWAGWLPALIAAFGSIMYVALYGLAKRYSVYGTLVGSLAGAVPPVVGYVAASGRLDLTAGGLFLVLACWQMPHFYAIAIYRLADYRAAKLPVWPAVRGVEATKWQIIGWIGAFGLAAQLLYFSGVTNMGYALIMGLACLAWLFDAVFRRQQPDANSWARRQFRWSLIALVLWSCLIAVTGIASRTNIG
jgi:protoheme IX farnesyltransferase